MPAPVYTQKEIRAAQRHPDSWARVKIVNDAINAMCGLWCEEKGLVELDDDLRADALATVLAAYEVFRDGA